jgi:predicted transcriptional regulator
VNNIDLLNLKIMSAVEIKTHLHQLIDATEDEKTLLDWLRVLSTTSTDFFEGLNDSQRVGIEQGLADLKAGRVRSHHQVKSKIQQKLERWSTK